MGAELQQQREVARIAAAQGGVISRRQLEGAGIERNAIASWIERGRLHRIHTGVFAVSHRHLDRRGRLSAALLRAGDGAALSHRSAASWLGLRGSARAKVDVTVPARGRRSPKGLQVHCSALDPADLTVHDGLRCTTVARTLIDVAGVLPAHAVERAFEQAQVLRLLNVRALHQAIERAGRVPGVADVRRLLGALGDEPAFTRSELERRLASLCREASLEAPVLNAIVAAGGTRHEVDALWPAARVIVELDGWATHGTRPAFERDRMRDAALAAAGYRVLRFTWRQVTETPHAVIAAIRAALAG